MAIGMLAETDGAGSSLVALRSEVLRIAEEFVQDSLLMSRRDLADNVAAIESVSKTVEFLQLAAARAVEDQNVAALGESSGHLGWSEPAASADTSASTAAASVEASDTATATGRKKPCPEFKDTADYLRRRLGISRTEARRRLRVAADTLPRRQFNGEPRAAKLEHLGEALAEGAISGKAATMIRDAVDRVSQVAAPEALVAMEENLTRQAQETNVDVLFTLVATWEAALDQDGAEPSPELLKARQGVFYKGKRNGLHKLEIAATDEQHEYIATVMNVATNPRIAANRAPSEHGVSPENPEAIGAEPENGQDNGHVWQDPRTREQQLLDGLVAGCKLALATDELPDTGGHRPQVMVTIGYQELCSEIAGSGHAVFGGLVTSKTARRIACDADIIPVVLGSKGEILDVGRKQRFFNRAMRRALVARDKGCAFPDCCIPAVWAEAHHIKPWWDGGLTEVANGALLCSFHHALMDNGNWEIEVRQGIPWFIPPAYLDPERRARRNLYWHAGIPEALSAAQAAVRT
ncbi:HNH endonuclease signature motif containing protein [Arthrobacter crystallopoietes]|uniref:HNH endonuclease signature motif containing protein n=1 Tax=Crystallibacter crystallopoietes TaxID=37928 RepID=UPI001ABDDC52|nr:HNH endonuclease signature motif containing protein [Arthrobacter crystallopoietes]QTG79429.1 DUF222 domain-containing protein [Arthrobacter crystallopoietes]